MSAPRSFNAKHLHEDRIAHQMIDLLTVNRTGLKKADFRSAIVCTDDALRNRLRAMRRVKLISSAGGTNYSRFYLLKFEAEALAHLKAQMEAARLKNLAHEAEKSRMRRAADRARRLAMKTRREDEADIPVVQRFIPAQQAPRPTAKINSVWALAL